MNIYLREVICTSRDGDRFWTINECYIRGANIKYIQIPDEVINKVKEETHSNKRQMQQNRGNQRGGKGHRGGHGADRREHRVGL